MPPVAALLHISMGALSLVTTGAFYVVYRKKKDKEAFSVALPFLFLGLYSLSLGIPASLSTDLEIINYGLIVGLVFDIFCVASVYRLALFKKYDIFRPVSKVMFFITMIVGVVLIGGEVIDKSLPIVSKSGIIFWEISVIGAWSFGALCVATGVIWVSVFLYSSKFVSDYYSRIKAYTLAADGVLWGLAGLLYFPSKTQIQSLTAFAMMIVSLVATALVFTIARIRSSS